jgi:hypothetical protein
MRVLTAVVLTLVVAGTCAQAQEDIATQTRAWGTRLTTTQTVGAWAFVGSLTDGGDGYRECATPTGACRAPVDLPTGLVLHGLEIDACDSSPVEEAVARLWACGPAPGPGACAIVAEARSGVANTAGCTRFVASVAPQLAINNYNYTYFADVFGTTGPAFVPVRFRGVRLAMVRQVSPAPATATFSDVPPSHPYFRHIEAMAGALITGGCGNGQFCPERALTRGEVAVLLAEALGLHFPD